MSKVNEMFGLYTNGESFPDLTSVLHSQTCPFSCKPCYKTRKSAPDTAIGTCSLIFDNEEQPILICPEPLTKDGKVFTDCLHFISNSIAGSGLYLIPEVVTSVGRIDYVLTAFRNVKPIDFVPIELQTLDTTGSIWNERQKLLIEHGYDVDTGEARSKGASLNWKMTAKTILAQLVQKSQLFSSMNKNLVLICQTPLYKYMAKNFNLAKAHDATLVDVLHFHMYDYIPENDSMALSLSGMRSIPLSAVEQIMGTDSIGSKEYAKICEALADKVCDEYRFVPTITRR